MTQQPPAVSSATTRSAVTGVQKMTPSEAFVETLVANGVTDMFGIMGSAFMDAMDIFAPAGIRLIPVVHEQGAPFERGGGKRPRGVRPRDLHPLKLPIASCSVSYVSKTVSSFVMASRS